MGLCLLLLKHVSHEKEEEAGIEKRRHGGIISLYEGGYLLVESDPSGSQPHWFHTLQARRLKVPRGRSNSDPLRAGTVQELFTRKAGLEFGAAHSYLSLEKLGEGAFASVYKGISRINGQLVALKVIRMKTEEGIPFTAIREASLLKHLKHANIVLLHDIIHTSETLTFVFEYVQTDLAQYMTQHPGGLHSHNVRIFMFQLLRALSYIHSRRILHRDLKPHNLLISYLGELKLADFGEATKIETSAASREMLQGSPAFPGGSDELEQLQNIWTVFGVPSESSWPGISLLPNYRPEWFVHCKPKQFRNIWKRLDQLSNKTEDLVQKILRLVPTERISAQEALLHPYFSILPAPIMHLRDTVSIFKVPGVSLETEFRDIFNPGRKQKSSLLPAASCW
uniref:cyclin-dependent kinase n=1 Tax=Cyprinodon variegatus TaxID=28743 RepID=A0A3Q2CJC9_CYPVA